MNMSESEISFINELSENYSKTKREMIDYNRLSLDCVTRLTNKTKKLKEKLEKLEEIHFSALNQQAESIKEIQTVHEIKEENKKTFEDNQSSNSNEIKNQFYILSTRSKCSDSTRNVSLSNNRERVNVLHERKNKNERCILFYLAVQFGDSTERKVYKIFQAVNEKFKEEKSIRRDMLKSHKLAHKSILTKTSTITKECIFIYSS